jgi:branched-chain amino acid transport system permease protein
VISRAKRIDRNVLALLLVVALLFPVPLFLDTTSQQEIAVRFLLFALLGVAWNVMGGFAGLFSFGHAAYFGIGAYTSAYLLVKHDVSPWLGMAAGALLAAAFGVLTGFLSFRYRLRGAYFALATFAFAEMLRLIVTKLEPVNASRGLRVPLEGGGSLSQLQFPAGDPAYFWVILALLAVGILVVILLMRSRSGAYIHAVREDEEAAEAAGVDVMSTKLLAVAVSAALTAVAGVFYVQFFFFVNPELAFGAAVSVQILLPAIIGGVGTIWGPAIGGALLAAIAELSKSLVDSPPSALSFLDGRSGLDLMLYGAVLIVIVSLLPRGLYPAIRDRVGRNQVKQASA